MEDRHESIGSLETPQDAGKGPRGVLNRWRIELRLADKEEESWREAAKKVLDRFAGESRKENSFNILWSNTETLAPALYNATPRPDIRRRFRDADPAGKAIAKGLERAVSYSLDAYDFDDEMTLAVLDLILPGRSVIWVRYEPTIVDSAVADEAVTCEAVPYDDFRRGPGKRWSDVPWVARRHRMRRADLEEKFGARAEEVTLDTCDDVSESEVENAEGGAFKAAEVWEVWDKEERRVHWIAPGIESGPLYPLDNPEGTDPLGLRGFFPCPRPAYAIQRPDSLVPVPLFSQYEEQAKELDRISSRIMRCVDAIKVRGVYDATIAEVGRLIEGGQNEMVPVENAAALNDRGFDHAIWFWPIDKVAAVLAQLYQARAEAKQAIYEISGLSDIVRGSSVASETATAQEIKNQWASLRIKKMQRDLQRLARDVIRLKTEIIAERFQPETLAAMTGADLQQVKVLLPLLRNDRLRGYRIDIETDSTIAALLSEDMKALREALTAGIEYLQGIAPFVQAGALPIEAAKAPLLSIMRRSKLGVEAEDAFDQIVKPQGQDPRQLAQMQEALQKQLADLDAQKGEADKKGQELAMREMNVKHGEDQLSLKQQVDREREKIRGEVDSLSEVSSQAQESAVVQGISQIMQMVQALGAMVNDAQQGAAAVSEQVDSVLKRLDSIEEQVVRVSQSEDEPRTMLYDEAGEIAGVERGGRTWAIDRNEAGQVSGLRRQN